MFMRQITKALHHYMLPLAAATLHAAGLLIQKGADIAQQTNFGITPAILAAKKKEQTVVEYLNSLA